MSSYVDATGVRREINDRTREALVAAMFRDGSTEATAAKSLADFNFYQSTGQYHISFVVRKDKNSKNLVLPVPLGRDRRARFLATLVSANGTEIEVPCRNLTGSVNQSVEISLPHPVSYGELNIRLASLGACLLPDRKFEVVIVPDRCWLPNDWKAKSASTGIVSNLYSIRSKRNWGIGDLADLKTIGQWAAKHRCDFVGVNPLHAITNCPPSISPYSPISRRFLNPIYIDVASVPEFRQSRAAQRLVESPSFQRRLARWRMADKIDYQSTYDAKLRVLRLLHREFVRRNINLPTERSRAFVRFLSEGDFYLREFARYCVVDEFLHGTDGSGDARTRPIDFRYLNSPAVEKDVSRHGVELSFYAYLQFVIEEQLADCQKEWRSAGDRIGLFLDVAVGSAPGGYDTTSALSPFVEGIDIGCPPDAHSAQGQNWSLAPLNPWMLRSDNCSDWRDIILSAMKFAGMVRIDHVMGLMRQFWIPKGRPPSEGAYVKYPFDEMVGVLALESHNHKCMVVGEDLGTVPKGFSELLEKRGILSTRMMMFERSRGGGFKSAKSYRRNAVTSATNHDLPPLRGYVDATDLELRRRIGLFKNKAEWLKAVEQRKRDVKALLRRLVQEKLLSRDEARDPAALSHDRLVEAVHGFLAKTPSRVIAVMLDDLFGDSEPINLPGVGPDQHASWTRRMSRSLEDGLKDKQVVRLLKAAMPKKRTRSKTKRK